MDFGDAVEAESGGAPVTSSASSSATAAAGGRRTSGGGGGVNGRGGGGRRRSSAGSRGDRLRQRRESTALCREGRTPDVVVCDGRLVDRALFRLACCLILKLKSFNFFLQFVRKTFHKGPFIKDMIKCATVEST